MSKLSQAVRTTTNGDGAVVLNVENGQLFNVNPVGSRILEWLKNGSPESEIVDRVSSEFNVGRSRAETDTREFIQVLRDHGLLEKQNSEEEA
jgi:hypothetical protein